eukprot:scaffold650234_cov46-Prasinocladus_malaysianus.AAC.1
MRAKPCLLASPVGSKQAEELPLLHGKPAVFDGLKVAKPATQAIDFEGQLGAAALGVRRDGHPAGWLGCR